MTIITTPRMRTSGRTNFHHVPIGTRPISNAPVTTAKVGVNKFSKPDAD